MPDTKFVSLAKVIKQNLDQYYVNKPSKREEALRDVLALVLTKRSSDHLQYLAASKDVRGMQTLLNNFKKHLVEKSKLTEALCSHYYYLQSEAKVKEKWGVKTTDWDYTHKFARELGVSLDQFYRQVEMEELDWHASLEKDIIFVNVVLDVRALHDMLISALEAYLAPRGRKRKGSEVCGINLGMTSERSDQKKGEGFRATKYVHIVRSQPQIAAEATYNSVEYNVNSLNSLLMAAHDLFPHLDVVGDFHSHPYDAFNELEASKGWEPSWGKEREIEMFAYMKEKRQRPLVTFIVSLAKGKKINTDSPFFKGLENTFQLCVGDCRIVLAAYRILESGNYTQENIRLDVSGNINYK